MAISKDLGVVTAYGYAVKKGYTGTEEEFAALMKDVADSAGTSEAWAAGTIAGTPVTPEAEQYHNNAKYYAEQAGGNAENAEQSKNSAKKSADTSEAWAVGTVGGVPVEEGQPGYNDNAKYYAEQASDSADAAANSEAAAKDYSDHIADPVSGIVTEWLNDHVDPESQVVIDDSLTIAGAAADAKATGDAVADLKSALGNETITLSNTGYIRTSDETTDFSVVPTDSYHCVIYNCSVGDMFLIYGEGTTVARLWAFADDDGNIISRSEANKYAWQNPDAVFTPDKATKVIINSSNNLKSYRIINYGALKKGLEMLLSEANQAAAIANNVDNMLYPIKGFETVNAEILSGKILRATGARDDTTNQGFEASTFIDVNPGETYYLSSSNMWGNGLLCFYTSNGVCLTDYNVMAENSENRTVLNRYEFTIPRNAYKIVIAGYQVTPVLERKEYAIGRLELAKFNSKLNGKKITVIGDSITEHNFWATTNWPMWLSEMTGCEIQNLGISGSGFWYTSPYINRIPQINADTDIIGVAVSFNDLGQGKNIGNSHDTGTDTICGYANDFFTALNAAFPTKPIICYSQGAWADIRKGIDYTGGTVLLQEMAAICANHGIPYYFDMYEKGSLLKPFIAANKTEYYKCDDETSEHYGQENGTHPNSKGHKIIANYLVSKFEENVLD